MGLIIHQDKITAEVAAQMQSICPFGALQYTSGTLTVNAACRSCKLCVKKGPHGAATWADEAQKELDKSAWRGVAVFAEMRGGALHPVTLELLGKARELAAVTGEPVYAVLIGGGASGLAPELLHVGADKAYVYDDPVFERFMVSPFAAAFYDFIQKVKPSSILVGATSLGRSLAPKVAARCDAGLTADCTVLEMKQNTDLVQIRPAFGGNIMAQIVTPNTRPQFCTARYKIFSTRERSETTKVEIVNMPVTDAMRQSKTTVITIKEKPKETDISEADAIVACGRGFTKEADLAMAKELAELLHAQMAGTRPMIEAGWLDPKRQIGLSGRTVKPKLLIALGISGSVQFAAGMKGSERIVAVNKDPNASVFEFAHVGLVGDLYEVVPRLIERIREGARNV
ncbi:MAG TPA: electron transfer flavoprotein subunit alpha [Clostridia bacterium]|nr:electron transfer flavoprotein subunit alpha [Clostridia bacterium]